MRITCFPAKIKGKILPPFSKSDAIRVIACALMSDLPVQIENLPSCDDSVAALCCAKALGATYDGKIFTPPEKFPGKATLDCGESGACLRFFTCITAAIGGEFTLLAEKSLLSRPMNELIAVLESGGVTVKKILNGWSVCGKLNGGIYEIDGKTSSQFVSGMLLALPLTKQKCVLRCRNLVSREYVNQTIAVMRKFSVNVEKSDGEPLEFKVDGRGYTSQKPPVTLCRDWSGGAFFLVAGALGGEITVCKLNENLPDSQIDEILSLCGCDTEKSRNDDGTVNMTVRKSEIKPFCYDFTDCPDLVPVCAVLAAAAKGESRLKNVARLKEKESDRVVSVTGLVRSLGAKAGFDGKDIVIYGGNLVGGKVVTYDDHRIAMSAAIAAVACRKEVEIDNAACVKKSYSSFWHDYSSVGGVTKIDCCERER